MAPRVLVAISRYYRHISDELEAGALEVLEAAGAKVTVMEVPGAFEIPGLIAMAADMIDLMAHDCAVAVAFVGDLLEVGNDAVVVAQVAARQDCSVVGRGRLDHDHGCATARAFAVVTEMPVGRQAVLGHVRGMGAKHDAAFERVPVQLHG